MANGQRSNTKTNVTDISHGGSSSEKHLDLQKHADAVQNPIKKYPIRIFIAKTSLLQYDLTVSPVRHPAQPVLTGLAFSNS